MEKEIKKSEDNIAGLKAGKEAAVAKEKQQKDVIKQQA